MITKSVEEIGMLPSKFGKLLSHWWFQQFREEETESTGQL
jgi:hypothetical protein